MKFSSKATTVLDCYREAAQKVRPGPRRAAGRDASGRSTEPIVPWRVCGSHFFCANVGILAACIPVPPLSVRSTRKESMLSHLIVVMFHVDNTTSNQRLLLTEHPSVFPPPTFTSSIVALTYTVPDLVWLLLPGEDGAGVSGSVLR